MNRLLSVLALLLGAWTSFVSAHTIITYPGQRGNNLQSNATFPNGFQWMYPCELVLRVRRCLTSSSSSSSSCS